MRIRPAINQASSRYTFRDLRGGDAFRCIGGESIWLKFSYDPYSKSSTNCINLKNGYLGLMPEDQEAVPVEGYFQIGKYPE